LVLWKLFAKADVASVLGEPFGMLKFQRRITTDKAFTFELRLISGVCLFNAG
jgi:hypothetical protein